MNCHRYSLTLFSLLVFIFFIGLVQAPISTPPAISPIPKPTLASSAPPALPPPMKSTAETLQIGIW